MQFYQPLSYPRVRTEWRSDALTRLSRPDTIGTTALKHTREIPTLSLNNIEAATKTSTHYLPRESTVILPNPANTRGRHIVNKQCNIGTLVLAREIASVGIDPKSAAALVTPVDISMFHGHDELACCCGLAPADSKSASA